MRGELSIEEREQVVATWPAQAQDDYRRRVELLKETGWYHEQQAKALAYAHTRAQLERHAPEDAAAAA